MEGRVEGRASQVAVGARESLRAHMTVVWASSRCSPSSSSSSKFAMESAHTLGRVRMITKPIVMVRTNT